MQVVVLAAGKGVRLGELTQDRPKPLVALNGWPLIEYALGALPDEISEIILIIGYRGQQIRDHLGSKDNGRPIRYLEMGEKELTGTATALWKARSFLKSRFLVIQGDDLHSKKDLEACLAYALAFGVSAPKIQNGLDVKSDSEGFLINLATESNPNQPISIATGAYVLDPTIFEYEPAQLSSGEYGLPQTIVRMAAAHKIKVVPMPSWLTVTYPEDIPRAENILAERYE